MRFLLAAFGLLVVVAACGQASPAGPGDAGGATPTGTPVGVVLDLIGEAAARSGAPDAAIGTTPSPAPTGTPNPLSGDTPVPAATNQSNALTLTSEREDVYYPVSGSDTRDIFAAIEANGPDSGEETEGHFTAGLAEYEATLETQTRVSGDVCVIGSGTVAVGFVVTLPRHEEYAGLSPEIQVRWDGYERRVAAHEQRHVSIFADVIDEVVAEIDGLSGEFADCDALEAETNAVWEAAFERDRALQAEFHAEVALASRDARAPLEARIAANEARLDDLNARLEEWSAESGELGEQVDAMDADVAVLVARMDEIEAVYPDLVLPDPLFGEFEALSTQAQALIEARNALASEHGAIVEAFNATTDEFNAINAATNELIEELNWQP